MTFAVSTDRLGKTYARKFSRRSIDAVKELSLQIEPGEIFGLLGPNGAGKTTLLKLLLGIVHPTSGEAQLFGQAVNKPSARMKIGYLPENHRFPPFLTAEQVLRVYGRLSNLERADIRIRSASLLERVGLREWENVRIREFSKGMMQRLGLAQALLNQPELLFLDEPTDGVDPIGRREIRDLLLSLREDGMTIFLNSHLLSEVEMVCTRVGILHHGSMAQSGTILELTGGLNRYRFRFPARFQDALTRQFPDLEIRPETDVENQISVGVAAESNAALNEWIDRFRTEGLEILRVGPDQKSLEARFVEIIDAMEKDPSLSVDSSGENAHSPRAEVSAR